MKLTMSPEMLREIGPGLLGSAAWQSPLARVLGVNPRTVRAWAAGRTPMSATMADTIVMLEELAEFAAEDFARTHQLLFRRGPGGMLFPAGRWTRRSLAVRVRGVPGHIFALQALNRLLLRHPAPEVGRHYEWEEL